MATYAHESEAQLAGLLTGYGVRFEYEPTTFVLETDADGNVVEAFTPDFYLPDFDTYVELTTLRQPLVTRKNRKVRRMADVHPDVNVKLLYRRDVEALGTKYGLVFADAA
ncbi:MAG: hypothetical protein ACPHIC_09770 [Acidimicrobiales bacterium]